MKKDFYRIPHSFWTLNFNYTTVETLAILTILVFLLFHKHIKPISSSGPYQSLCSAHNIVSQISVYFVCLVLCSNVKRNLWTTIFKVNHIYHHYFSSYPIVFLFITLMTTWSNIICLFNCSTTDSKPHSALYPHAEKSTWHVIGVQ